MAQTSCFAPWCKSVAIFKFVCIVEECKQHISSCEGHARIAAELITEHLTVDHPEMIRAIVSKIEALSDEEKKSLIERNSDKGFIAFADLMDDMLKEKN